jgi:hypothetical protein
MTAFELKDGQLQELDRALQQAEEDGARALPRAFIGERAIGISIFSMSYKQLNRYGGTGIAPGSGLYLDAFKIVAFNAYGASGMRELDRSIFLESLAEFIDAATNKFPEKVRAAELVEARADQRLKEGSGSFAVVSRMLLPSISHVSFKEASAATELRSARVAAAIERYRLQHGGKMPAALSALVPQFLPALLLDANEGKPLLLTRNKRGYAIESAESADARRKHSKRPPNSPKDFTVAR